MQKKLFSLVALLVMLFCSAAAAEDDGGEMFKLHGYTDGILVFESIYLDPHDGPGYDYFPVSLDLPKGASVKVLTQVTDSDGNRWVLVESGKIRAYLLQQDARGKTLIDCRLDDVPAEPAEMLNLWSCMLYEDCRLLYGPGAAYESSEFTADPDSYGYVVLMNGEWALVEFQGNADGASWLPQGRKTRGWIFFENLQY